MEIFQDIARCALRAMHCQKYHGGALLSAFVLFSACDIARADVTISGLDDIVIEAWAGSTGDLQGSDSYCGLSFLEKCTGPWWNRNCPKSAEDYNVAAYTSGPTDGAGNFYLTHESGTETLAVRFDWFNPEIGVFAMSDFNATGYTTPVAPGATECTQPAAQNTITITVPADALGSAVAGIYSETFQIDMCRLNGGGNNAECITPVNFVVTVPELIQITQLTDLVLGAWTGSGSLQKSTGFCVFRNGAGGFTLTIAGENDGSEGFNVRDGSSTIPYGLDVSDGPSSFPLEPGETLTSQVTAFTGKSTRNCGGTPSHTLRATMQQLDLEAALPGTYTDTITVLAEPE